MAIDYLVPFAVDKRNLCPAFPPTPIIDQPIKRGQVFEFKVRVDPKPDYELTSYDRVHHRPAAEFRRVAGRSADPAAR